MPEPECTCAHDKLPGTLGHAPHCPKRGYDALRAAAREAVAAFDEWLSRNSWRLVDGYPVGVVVAIQRLAEAAK